uniref:Protein kinase putative n=1 Tax=Albugo laibachii Nc14 TaxID=890382 RepID=F0VYW4_9STRA|nr:protein kinase putative [Albugo laibachii Nc14]|eukprot:CCA13979.1 protein kinase putative [Albugo laibachii Nc14]
MTKLIAQTCSVSVMGYLITRNIGKFFHRRTFCRSSAKSEPRQQDTSAATAESSPSARILWAAWCSDFAFSVFGWVQTFCIVTKITPVNDFRLTLYAQAPHWSFQIASFCWMGVLAIYITSQRREQFDVMICHYVIWIFILFYWILEISAVYHRTAWYTHLATFIWKAVAAINFGIVIICWAIYARRTRKRLRNGHFVISKLVAYTICFMCFVSPNIIAELVHGTTRKYTIQMVFSALLQLWPTANGFIALTKTTWCLCFLPISQASNASAEMGGKKRYLMSQKMHELKGLEIGEKIGQGVAVVYMGKWRGAQVAVKMKAVMSEESEDDVLFQHACNLEIQEEAQVMKQLSHPNIVLFMEAGFYRGSICIISEYCARGSLRDVLVRKIHQLSWPTRIRLALGIAHGIQYLHSAKPAMIHRDLKSPNVLVDDSWHAKIADFGTLRFAEIVSSVRNSIANGRDMEPCVMTGVVGTTRWMAPEMILGNKVYTSKVDIYSLGLILWELIEGKLPFETMRWNHEIEKVILQGLRPSIDSKQCPIWWKVLVSRCWDSDPENRPTIQEVIRTLQRIAREEFCGEKNYHGTEIVSSWSEMDQNAGGSYALYAKTSGKPLAGPTKRSNCSMLTATTVSTSTSVSVLGLSPIHGAFDDHSVIKRFTFDIELSTPWKSITSDTINTFDTPLLESSSAGSF